MIAITYDKETNSVFQHFGQTEYFYLFNEKAGEERIVDNGGYTHRDLIPYLNSLGVTTLICGGVGTHAVELLESFGINLIPGASGDVKDVIEAFKTGRLALNPNAIHSCSH